MKLLNSAFTLSLLCSIALSVFAQQSIPPSTEPRCVCMPGNSTGVLLKPGQMGVSSGQIESCPCVPKEDKEDKASKQDKKSDEGSDKSNATPDANTSSDTSQGDASTNSEKNSAASDASSTSDNANSSN